MRATADYLRIMDEGRLHRTLGKEGMKLFVLSPTHNRHDNDLRRKVTAMAGEVLVNRHYFKGEEPLMAPGELKDGADFGKEFKTFPEKRIMALLYDQRRKEPMGMVTAPVFTYQRGGMPHYRQDGRHVVIAERSGGQVVQGATAEYVSANIRDYGQGSGTGSLMIAVLRGIVHQNAVRNGHVDGGVLLEAIVEADSFWNDSGAKLLVVQAKVGGKQCFVAFRYAMPNLESDPKTGLWVSPKKGILEKFFPERLRLFPALGGIPMGEVALADVQAMLAGFFQESYSMGTEDFKMLAGYYANQGTTSAVLHDVCGYGVRPEDRVFLHSNTELRRMAKQGIPTYVWEKKPTLHQLGVNGEPSRGRLICLF